MSMEIKVCPLGVKWAYIKNMLEQNPIEVELKDDEISLIFKLF